MKILTITFIFAIILSDSIKGQIHNSSFENWDTIYPATYTDDLINKFLVPDPVSGEINNWTSASRYGICRTTDSYSGNYSLILHNWYLYIPEKISYKSDLDFKPTYLKGNYKYIGEILDGELPQASARITLKNKGDTISNVTYYFDTISIFKPFEIELKYEKEVIPDSIFIVFKNSDQPCNPQINTNICNLFYVDNLSLTKDAVSSINSFLTKPLILYPNPGSDIINIIPAFSNFLFEIYNLNGEIVLSGKNNRLVDISRLTKGLYIFKLFDISTSNYYTEKLQVQ